jgi:hypothetical protein
VSRPRYSSSHKPVSLTINNREDVLKFEYFTQLLLDSNYIPLVLKLFAHQDIQQVVDSKMDRVDSR